jgi:hypothetical protein
MFDLGASYDQMEAAFAYFASPHEIVRTETGAAKTLPLFARGVNAQELLAGAFQGDVVAIVRVKDWVAAFGEGTEPKKFDRIELADGRYTIQTARGAPESGRRVFFKLFARGGNV